ncbi:gustatory receptor for sugar taste 64f-like [Belonocnema kinseyi]|uniref:gustatory receptor for sugar taste 64f-like n=1 Tax=Belonocnema kinseyi TaxID=2817044 RepID=UPI00143DE890|nr:gustatory receptor for sugar taste 64f-like [Belonocnema kinseyi]
MKSIAVNNNNRRRLKFHCWSRKMAVKKVEAFDASEPLKVEKNSFSFFGKSSQKVTSIERRVDVPPSPKRGALLGNSNSIGRRDSMDTQNPDNFASAIGLILLVAQFFGILPISGIRSSTPKKFKFRKTSPRTLFTYTVVLGNTVMTVVCLIHMVKTFSSKSFQIHGGISDATVGAVFYVNTLIGTILFLTLSPRWISLQYDWRTMEQYVDRCKTPRPKLRLIFSILSASILMPALAEHLLSIVSNSPSESWTNSTFDQFLEMYTIRSHPFLVKHVEYNFTLGLYTFVISRIATFTWNFTDLFIMLISTGIAERYKQLNKKVTTNESKQFSPGEWKELRENYAILSTLVKKVDDQISSIIFLSFGNNLYFICLQLLNGLSLPEDGKTINTIYFFASFIFLVGRTVAVTLFTARINDQSKVVLPCLFNCTAPTYTSEAQRLQVQLTTDEVALTGLRFFSITRNFMLAVAGAIVTYEVVLLQFNLALRK